MKISQTKQKALTFTQAHKLFEYDPDTGALLNRVHRHRKARAGEEAGFINVRGYRVVKINNYVYKAHRIIWFMQYGDWPVDQIDHIDHDKTNNRIKNLREATNRENSRNQKLSIRNTSGIIGVCWDKWANKFLATIRVNGKLIHLGRFDDISSAAKCRNDAEVKYGFHENHGYVG